MLQVEHVSAIIVLSPPGPKIICPPSSGSSFHTITLSLALVLPWTSSFNIAAYGSLPIPTPTPSS